MKKIIQYEIVIAPAPLELKAKVNGLIEKDFEPIGGIATVSHVDRDGLSYSYFYQAMGRYE
jgi:hypothetical protein